MNEYELDLLRQRSVEARREKARRGELIVASPAGYVKSEEPRLEKDPDRRVQECVSLVFGKFLELGSALLGHLSQQIPCNRSFLSGIDVHYLEVRSLVPHVSWYLSSLEGILACRLRLCALSGGLWFAKRLSSIPNALQGRPFFSPFQHNTHIQEIMCARSPAAFECMFAGTVVAAALPCSG